MKTPRVGAIADTVKTVLVDALPKLPLAVWFAVMTAVPIPLIVTIFPITVATLVLPLVKLQAPDEVEVGGERVKGFAPKTFGGNEKGPITGFTGITAINP